MAVLSVNLNKIALVRNSRQGERPSVVEAARTVIRAGARGITVHPRPDQRHIRPHDVADLTTLLRNDYPQVEFNIEGNPQAGPNADGYPGFDALIESARPDQATLVPDSDDQLTSDHGFDLTERNESLAAKIELYQSWGARVSLFMDPLPAQITAAKAHGADRIELYTGPFAETLWANGPEHPETQTSVATYQAAAHHAAQLGLGVNAGHDLDLANLPTFMTIQEVLEVSIGHALISDALDHGLYETVRAYLQAVDPAT
jgi:pyridoxine 5-phosphate synthase